MQQKAVLDRIVENKAVLLVGDEQIEQIISIDTLPDNAKEGDWLTIEFDETNDNVIIRLEIDEESTNAIKERIAYKMSLLRQRGRN
jgi:hypothetical protein